MSVAKRCGKFFAEERKANTMTGVVTHDKFGTRIKRYDLCSDCVEKFTRFMLNEETECKETELKAKWKVRYIPAGGFNSVKIYYCPNCLSESNHDTNYCSYCGMKLEGTATFLDAYEERQKLNREENEDGSTHD